MSGGPGSGGRRDPVSELFDRGARVLLLRAYARPGRWAGTRLVAATPVQAARLMAEFGINVYGRDQWGRPRWAAGFVRAVYYQHKWFYAQGGFSDVRRLAPNDVRGISYELGRLLPAVGVVPAGRAVRIMSRPGGGAALRAVAKMPASRRIFDDEGAPAGRWADPALRDW